MTKVLFLDNIVLKAAALVLAVILWVFVTSKGQTEMTLNVPIEYTNIPPGIEMVGAVVKSTSIVIMGHESLLKNIRPGDVRVYVDVGRAKKGEGIFYIKKDAIKLPYAATVTKIEPSSVKVVFEETISKRVPVRPVITGSPAEGWYVSAVEISPRDVLIEGARSEVARIGYIRTEPIDITGLAENLRQEIGLDISGRNVRAKIDRVDVHIRIVKRSK
ncbi:MAG: CdaR family protein [Thermodesulfovibrionales bacterium]